MESDIDECLNTAVLDMKLFVAVIRKLLLFSILNFSHMGSGLFFFLCSNAFYSVLSDWPLIFSTIVS